jgi:hypothetical protein
MGQSAIGGATRPDDQNRWLLTLASAALLAACGSSRLASSPDGTGGTGGAGTGGAPGHTPDGSIDGGVCVATPGPITSASPPRQTFGWTFAPAPGADAGTSFDASAPTVVPDGGTASRCETVTPTGPGGPPLTTSCVGEAWLRQMAAGPTLVFDDGSAFTWDGSLPAIAAPYLASSSGVRVWADFESTVKSDCTVCASYATSALEIRAGAGGTLLFLARQGSGLPAMTDGQIMDIFGVPATAVPQCTFEVGDGVCISFERTEYGHQLATTPVQSIPSGVWSTVTVPTGSYATLWYSSSETEPKVTCTDEPGTGKDNGFVISKLSP